MYEQFGMIRDELKKSGYDLGLDKLLGNYILRYKANKKFTKREHCEGLILSILSANRPWIGIERNLDNLYKVFHGYDPDFLREANPQELVQEVCRYECGNRRIVKQMEEISYNVKILDAIEEKFGDVDFPMQLAAEHTRDVLWVFSDNKSAYKFKGVAVALAAQYMKNMGVDLTKPDVHIRRMIQRLWTGYLPDEYEAIATCKEIADKYGITQTEVGTTLWQFCAIGYLEICGANPRCDECPAFKACHYGQNYF